MRGGVGFVAVADVGVGVGIVVLAGVCCCYYYLPKSLHAMCQALVSELLIDFLPSFWGHDKATPWYSGTDYRSMNKPTAGVR